MRNTGLWKRHIRLWLLLAVLLTASGVQAAGQTAGTPASYASEKSSVPAVKTKKAFYTKLKQYLVKGKTTFQIRYTGKDNVSQMAQFRTMLTALRKMDDKTTSDDADFLTNNIYQIAWSAAWKSGAGTTLTFHVVYWETAKQTKAVNKKVASALKKLGVSGMSDISKIKAIHDYIVGLVSYDRTLTDHSAYGGLVASKHTTVCQGYAGIAYKMLTDAGINTRIVTGYVYSGGTWGSHAWNIVKIGKKWYHLDVTYDDPLSYYSVLRYNYFLVGSDTISRDHYLDPEYGSYKYSSKDYNWSDAE